jgi:DNA-binding winged helix-turn-helix (wHTH) protein/predicted ATPase
LRNESCIVFEPFCLDRSNECLWRGSEVIKLRPKAYAVLNQLVGHFGQLVTKEELLAAVWPETFVGDAVLKVAIRQLRDALDDNPKAPLFIETAHRRGYRFIGHIEDRGELAHEVSTLPDREVQLPLGFVGRDKTLSLMRRSLEKMLGGERQIVFVTGEPGIGKTALVDTFARFVGFDPQIRLGRGQCLEQYGTSEAYLPILEAIGRLCREQSHVVEVLRAHAPMWLLQMPSLLNSPERELLNREVLGATRERMLREMGDALDQITSDQPLVLILEDLHWSDRSTLDLISYLATQRAPAQLMLIGTYRSAELIASGHPLRAVKQELLAKQQCAELALDYLSEESTAKYLSVRFAHNRFPNELARSIHQRTEGNPLFMVNAVDYLVNEELLVNAKGYWELAVGIEKVELGVPDSIKQMIEKQVENLDPEAQQTLEVASLAGAEFSTLALVDGLGGDLATVETRCEQLARQRHFIQHCGVQVLPNGEAVGRYGFIHALYQNVLYDRVSPSKRIQLHRRIAERGEQVYGERAGEIAGELAMHFERGRDYKRAAKYLQRGADNAIRRHAYREAVGLARRGLEVLEMLPDSSERAGQELCLQLTLGVPLTATEGYGSANVGDAYRRARELCQQTGDTPDVSEVLWGLWVFCIVRSELGAAREIAEEFLQLAERFPYPGLTMRGHEAMEVTLVQMGQFALALEHFEKGLALYDPEQHREDAFLYSQNPEVAMRSHAAWALWFLGQPDRALEQINEALKLARELVGPHGLAHVYYFGAMIHILRREHKRAQELAEAALAVSRQHGLVMYEAFAMIVRGWTLAEQGLRQEGIEQIRQGLAIHQGTGAKLGRPQFFALLGDALVKAGQTDEALRVFEEALELAHERGEERNVAELYRLKGELLLLRVGEDSSAELTEAEACFNQSVQIAQQQKAKSWELRASMSLARVFAERGKPEAARLLLTQIYDQFTEGFDTRDLLDAKALLDQLSD